VRSLPVAQNCILLFRRFGTCEASAPSHRARSFPRPADCKSAIQQIENLRYAGSCHALLQRHSSGAEHSPALTGLFTT